MLVGNFERHSERVTESQNKTLTGVFSIFWQQRQVECEGSTRSRFVLEPRES